MSNELSNTVLEYTAVLEHKVYTIYPLFNGLNWARGCPILPNVL
jgi:hypothetical protein